MESHHQQPTLSQSQITVQDRQQKCQLNTSQSQGRSSLVSRKQIYKGIESMDDQITDADVDRLPCSSKQQPQQPAQMDLHQLSVETDGPNSGDSEIVSHHRSQTWKSQYVLESHNAPHTANDTPKKQKCVFKVSMYKDDRWYHSYNEGCKCFKWYREFDLDPVFVCKHLCSHTKTGSKQKRSSNSKVFWEGKQPEE